MDRLINELTFYSKIDTNKIPYTFSKINVANYFRDCVEEVGLELEARGIELGYFNFVDEDVMVIADAEQMKRKWMLQSMPSSTSGSYTSTSVNRLISENHIVQSYVYSPGTVAFRSLCDCSTFRVSPRITNYRLLVTRRSAF